MGFRIFRHAIRMVFTQFGSALRISGVLYLASFAISLGLGFLAGFTAPAEAAGLEPVQLASFLASLVTMALFLWIAIGWHRFVLLDERPSSVVPPFRGDRILAYFGRTVQTVLIMTVPLAVVLFLTVFLAAAAGPDNLWGTVVVWLVAMFGAAFVTYRLSPMLPGAALGRGLGVAAAWKSTNNISLSIFALAVICAIASVVIDIPGGVLTANPSTIWFGMAWFAIAGWVKVMVGVSIITTIYGVCVEQREIA